jgi:Basic region leucine zipper
MPTYFSKGRNSDQPSPEEEEDELTEEPLASNATDQEKIEWKRRQNTLAARRSRTRKMMKVQNLEETVERLTKEKEIWKTRALTLKQLLHSHGIICPDFRD